VCTGRDDGEHGIDTPSNLVTLCARFVESQLSLSAIGPAESNDDADWPATTWTGAQGIRDTRQVAFLRRGRRSDGEAAQE
jgi:hypothetical protein